MIDHPLVKRVLLLLKVRRQVHVLRSCRWIKSPLVLEWWLPFLCILSGDADLRESSKGDYRCPDGQCGASLYVR